MREGIENTVMMLGTHHVSQITCGDCMASEYSSKTHIVVSYLFLLENKGTKNTTSMQSLYPVIPALWIFCSSIGSPQAYITESKYQIKGGVG